MNAIFRLFHSMKGSVGFLDFMQISDAAHAAENLLDLIRTGGIKMEPEHIDLFCRSCDFAKEALEHVENKYCDQGMAEQASELTFQLEKAINEALQKIKAFRADTHEIGSQSTTGQDGGQQDKKDPDQSEEFPGFEMQITQEMIDSFVHVSDELLNNFEQRMLQWSKAYSDQEIVF